ncbi:MAG: MBL fold metallo-hydrolase [Clostridia bacterium]|nr:MBL fold metallo-hydrolase [Clostridia bacterium]MBQ4131054.1 MBL fold metallo-hydrolase [Clostridia bacterium]MBQ9919478.1 MBL fold metallo-hydrolase [Clostridia bacterium]
MAKRNFKKRLSGLVAIIVLFIVIWQGVTRLVPNTDVTPHPATGENLLVAEFLDVDQADCELIFLPDGKILLIDAGNRGDGEEIVAYLKGKNISKIDYVVATHPHADHIGGMSDVIDSFEIGKIFVPRVASSDVPTTKTYEDFLTSVQNKGLKLSAAKAGTTLFEGADYKADCFAPCSEDYKELNDYSVVIKLSYGIHSFLFTGDAEILSENEMLNAGYNLNSDVIKLGHHGSHSSSSEEFLKAVSPSYAVISCGEGNDYGHPHDETLEALANLNGPPKTLRTDLDKTIIFKADGKTENGIIFSTKHDTVVE